MEGEGGSLTSRGGRGTAASTGGVPSAANNGSGTLPSEPSKTMEGELPRGPHGLSVFTAACASTPEVGMMVGRCVRRCLDL